MVVVLAFLLGMPLAAVPQVREYLERSLVTNAHDGVLGDEDFVSQSAPTDGKTSEAEPSSAITTLAANTVTLPARPKSNDMTIKIEALKAQLVDAGVSYMVLEQIEGDSPKYRFRIDLPAVEGSAYMKRFQVIDDAPDQAMRRALADLQKWRFASREPTRLDRPKVMLR